MSIRIDLARKFRKLDQILQAVAPTDEVAPFETERLAFAIVGGEFSSKWDQYG